MTACRSARTQRQVGFTLVELMVVVVITGILAIIGVSIMRSFAYSSKATEASASIQAIRAAQERWRAETLSYLRVSGSMTSWYPNPTPAVAGTITLKYAWDNPGGNDKPAWDLLNPSIPGPVQYGYVTWAGAPTQLPPAFSTATQPAWQVPTQPWYVIEAICNANGDGVMAHMAASSFTDELYTENSGE